MTILSLLKNYDNDMGMKVGAYDGNGFYYIGTVGDFAENIIEYDNAVKDRAVKQVKKSEKALKETLSSAPKLEDYAKEQLKKDIKDLTFMGFQVEVEIWFHDVEVKQKTLAKREERLKSFIHLAHRNVRDYAMCDTGVEENCLRVLLDGHENGAFWMMNEATPPSLRFATDTEDD